MGRLELGSYNMPDERWLDSEDEDKRVVWRDISQSESTRFRA